MTASTSRLVGLHAIDTAMFASYSYVALRPRADSTGPKRPSREREAPRRPAAPKVSWVLISLLPPGTNDPAYWLVALRAGIVLRTPSVQSGSPCKGGSTTVRQEVEDEEEVPAEAEDDEEEEAGPNQAEPEEEGEASLDEILAKKPDHAEDDDESILAMGRDDRSETLSVKVEPKKDTEFVCRKCHLVKPIRSQLVDKARMLCRDCA